MLQLPNDDVAHVDETSRRRAYIYAWSQHDMYRTERGVTPAIYAFAIDERGRTVCFDLVEYAPYAYIELSPKHGAWTSEHVAELVRRVRVHASLVACRRVRARKLYYAHRTRESAFAEDCVFEFLRVECATVADLRTLKKRGRVVTIAGRGREYLAIHETNVAPILQLTSTHDVPATGWVTWDAPMERDARATALSVVDDAQHVTLRCSDLHRLVDETPATPNATILAFDIEVYASRTHEFPDAAYPKDRIFQIACIVWSEHSSEGASDDALRATQRAYLLTLGRLDHARVTPGTIVRECRTEYQLLDAFARVVSEEQPHVITGYNILDFDFPYVIDRATLLGVRSLLTCGVFRGNECEVSQLAWSSSAYGEQRARYVDWDGRVVMDMISFVRREIQSDSYSLDTIAARFVNATKHAFSTDDIFRAYRTGVLFPTDEGRDALTACANYCVQDAVLVRQLFDLFGIWTWITEMGSVCNVPCSYIYLKGQQIKVFSLVYQYCVREGFVVNRDAYHCADNERYQGAFVKQPVPGMYRYVVPMDFASLYPTIIIAYNIDYSTFVIDAAIPDELCHVLEWTEEHKYDVHTCFGCGRETRGQRASERLKYVDRSFRTQFVCEHCQLPGKRTYEQVRAYPETRARKSGAGIAPPTRVFTDTFKYRWLKKTAGVLPTILVTLLDARRATRARIKHTASATMRAILNNRQKAIKVACNSVYGGLGFEKGPLPLVQGAMCVTAQGRFHICDAARYMQERYGVVWIYTDTDSVYVTFPDVAPAEIWALARRAETEIREAQIFPAPMDLEFENEVYDPFLIFNKKRYVYTKYNEDGSRSTKLGYKGVILVRRDGCEWVRAQYRETLNAVFAGTSSEDMQRRMVQVLNRVCAGDVPASEFVITKSIKSASQYKIKPLPEDPAKRAQRLAALKCTEQTYAERALPAHVQLEMKMQRRGLNTTTANRLPFVITTAGGRDAALFDKVEDPEYARKHIPLIALDYLYYIKQLASPVDELFRVAFGLDTFVITQHKWRMAKQQAQDELVALFRARVLYPDEDAENIEGLIP